MKKRLSSALSLFLLMEIIGMPISASQSQPNLKKTSDSLLSQYRLGLGLGAEYINASANLKVLPKGLGNIGGNYSQVGKNLQVAPCLEVGTTIAQNYYLGLLASWRYSGAKNSARVPMTNRNDYLLHDFKLNSYVDVFIKPGYKVTPRSMVYGLVGPSFATWTHTTTMVGTGNPPFKIDGKSLGVGLGLGFEYLFQENYALSFDYAYHFHRSTTKSQSANYVAYLPNPGPGGMPPFLQLPLTGTLQKSVSPSYGTFALRFTYFFSL